MSQSSEYSEKEIREGIDSLIKILDFNLKVRQNMGLIEIYGVMGDLKGLLDIYSELNPIECGRVVISKYIGIINLLINLESSNDRIVGYHDHLENAYRLAGRVSLEHFIMYYEWYEEEKLLEERYEILEGYCYYLNNRYIRHLSHTRYIRLHTSRKPPYIRLRLQREYRQQSPLSQGPQ